MEPTATNGTAQRELTDAEKHARSERWYAQDLRKSYVDNDNTATLLRKIVESMEKWDHSLAGLLTLQAPDDDDAIWMQPVGGNSTPTIRFTDGTSDLTNAFVRAYLPAGIVVVHLKDDPHENGNMINAGREFIPYHRIKSIFEEV